MICVAGAGRKDGSSIFKNFKMTEFNFRLDFNSPPKALSARQDGFDAFSIDYADYTTLEAAFKGYYKTISLKSKRVEPSGFGAEHDQSRGRNRRRASCEAFGP
ncbi:MAG: hypothetical protein AAF922_16445 [Pseudomonadota bacterium]